MLLSIAVISYNHQKYVDDFYKSLLLSLDDFKNDEFEIMHFDDFSSDSTIEYVAKYSGVVNVIEAQENLGVGGNLYRIINYEYRGDWVVIISCDDLLTPDYFAKLLKIGQNYDFVLFNATCFNNESELGSFGDYFGQRLSTHLLTLEHFLEYNRLYPANFNIRKRPLLEVRKKIINAGLATEWIMSVILIIDFHGIFIDETNWLYRITSNSASNSAVDFIWHKDKKKALNYCKDIFGESYFVRHEYIFDLFRKKSFLIIFFKDFWIRLYTKIRRYVFAFS
jgi:glycosyltransferase involved in cell wall biosynthesis